jgi:hypothetical protein
LYCLICVATVKRVRMTVEGWAGARAVCCKGCLRKACWRTEAAQARRRRRALARHVVADVRSLGRAQCTALIAFAPLPRAQERTADPCGGVGASIEVTTKRGGAPTAMPAALRLTRHGWPQDAAAEGHSSSRRLLTGGRAPGARASAVRGWGRVRASCRRGAAWRSQTALPAQPKTQSIPRRWASTSHTSGVATGLSPRTRRGVWGPCRRSAARRRTKIRACSSPGGRVPGRRPAVTHAWEVPSKLHQGREP